MPNTLVKFIETNKNYVIRMILFDRIKTGDPFIDSFLITLILGVFSWIVSWLYDNNYIFFSNISFDDIKTVFLKKKYNYN